MTRFTFFRIDSIEDQVDAIDIYGGELIREVIDTLQNVLECDDEHNDLEQIIAKLDNYFIPMTNSDSARRKFAEMPQIMNESVAQYHFRLRTQAAKCKFPDKKRRYSKQASTNNDRRETSPRSNGQRIYT